MAINLPFLKLKDRERTRVLAVDIGKFATKAVYITVANGRHTLAGFTIVQSPENILSFDPETVASLLKNIANILKLENAPTAVSIGPAFTIIKTVEMPLLPVVELRKIIKNNPKVYLQQDLTDYVFDCHCLPPQVSPQQGSSPTTIKQRVIVGGAPTSVVNNIASGIRAAGLQAEGVVPGMITPINSLEHTLGENLSKEVLAVVDLGYETSLICVLDHGEPVLSRIVPVGGKHITEELTKVLKIEYTEAEEIKTSTPEAALITLEQVVRPLGRELRALVDFFEHQFDRQVTRVFACGGSASSPPILQILESELFVECKTWNPASGMDIALPPEQLARFESAMPQLITAIGCALAVL